MKFFVVVLALCSFGMSAHGQFAANVGASEINQAPSSPVIISNVQRVQYKIAYPPGYRMRNTGRLLTLIGAPLLIGGIIMMSNADHEYQTVTTSSGTYTEVDPQEAGGALMIVVGAGLTVPGVIFWSKGAKKLKRHMERTQDAAFKIDNKGLSLSYRF